MSVQWWHIVVVVLLAVVGWLINALRLHSSRSKIETDRVAIAAANQALLGATVASTAKAVSELSLKVVTSETLKIAVLELKQEMQKLFNDRYVTRKESEAQMETQMAMAERIGRIEREKLKNG